jgi:hypothetical protein
LYDIFSDIDRPHESIGKPDQRRERNLNKCRNRIVITRTDAFDKVRREGEGGAPRRGRRAVTWVRARCSATARIAVRVVSNIGEPEGKERHSASARDVIVHAPSIRAGTTSHKTRVDQTRVDLVS